MTDSLGPNKRFAHCPDCGAEMSPHALLCRDCYKRAGATRAAIYKAAKERGEASPRSNHTTEWHIKRASKLQKGKGTGQGNVE